MSIFKERFGNYEFIYPAFKFQNNNHATSMVNNGTTHISNITTFRDKQKFDKLTLDENEGMVTLRNKISPQGGYNSGRDHTLRFNGTF